MSSHHAKPAALSLIISAFSPMLAPTKGSSLLFCSGSLLLPPSQGLSSFVITSCSALLPLL